MATILLTLPFKLTSYLHFSYKALFLYKLFHCNLTFFSECIDVGSVFEDELGGLDDVLDELQMTLMIKHHHTCLIPALITILRCLCQHNPNTRHKLATQKNIYLAVLRSKHMNLGEWIPNIFIFCLYLCCTVKLSLERGIHDFIKLIHLAYTTYNFVSTVPEQKPGEIQLVFIFSWS